MPSHTPERHNSGSGRPDRYGFGPNGEPILYEDATLVILDDSLARTGDARAMAAAHPEAHRLCGLGKVITQGLINAHHHVGMTPFQLDSPNYPLELWFASRLALRDIGLRLDTLFSAFEMIASGATTDQHLHRRAPGDVDAVLGAARKVTAAYREIGMRASYSIAWPDQNRLVYQDDRLFTESRPRRFVRLCGHFLNALPSLWQISAPSSISSKPNTQVRIR